MQSLAKHVNISLANENATQHNTKGQQMTHLILLITAD
jgi:hypothetical protein